MTGVATRMSKCCGPVPGDEIVGFITRGRGVTIHRTDCVNVMNLTESERERLVETEWILLDDSEAKGFMFSYDKLFGIKDLSDTDKKNRIDGKETSVERNQRLFYVTCTRAKNSLAVVMYTDNPQEVKKESIRKGWFDDKEIIIM